jgi:hypothetical protein
MQGNILVPLVMFGWLPLVLYIFSRYPPQRALLISFVIAWLFLPQASLAIPIVPDYGRITATCYGVLLGTLIFDVQRLAKFRYSWIDIPITVWCLCPVISSLTNDLGPYDAFVTTLEQIWSWGLPYFLGRIYLNDFSGLRQLAVAVFIGGLVYVPLCIIESRLSLSIHLVVYGFQHPSQTFLFAIRYGGYRPSVFLESGLMLGVWLMWAALSAVVLWRTKNLPPRMWNLPTGFWVGVILFTFAIQRSTGAYILFLLGLLIMFLARWLRITLPLWIIYAIIIAFVTYSAIGAFPRKEVIAFMSQFFEAERIQSVEFRFMNEEILGEKARQRWLFGWGGFGRNRIYNELGEDITVTDSLWIIVFGVNGIVGLISCFGTLLLPPLAFVWRYPARLWSHPLAAPAAAMAVSVVLYAFDCVLNAMINPLFTLTAGGIAGIVMNPNPIGVLPKVRTRIQPVSNPQMG